METRREFLKHGAFLAAGAAGGGALLGQATPPAAKDAPAKDPAPRPAPAGVPAALADSRQLAPRLKLSCAAYSYRQFLEKEKAMTLDGFIERCARMGLDGTELTSYYFPRTDAEYLNHLKRKAFLLGLDVSGTAIANDFCRRPGPERDKDLRHVKDWIGHAARLGAMTIRVFSGGVPAGDTEEAARARAIEGLKESCEHAAKEGVILALENHGGLSATSEGILAICRGVDSPWFGVNLDTGNFNTDDPYRDLELVAPYAVTVQVKTEVTARGQKKVEADLPRILGILRAVNYRGYVALEYEAAEDPMTAVPRYVEKLKGLLS
jgi:sugar phosphate isomerase/epimerase